jgi:hypothetical protein
MADLLPRLTGRALKDVERVERISGADGVRTGSPGRSL